MYRRQQAAPAVVGAVQQRHRRARVLSSWSRQSQRLHMRRAPPRRGRLPSKDESDYSDVRRCQPERERPALLSFAQQASSAVALRQLTARCEDIWTLVAAPVCLRPLVPPPTHACSPSCCRLHRMQDDDDDDDDDSDSCSEDEETEEDDDDSDDDDDDDDPASVSAHQHAARAVRHISPSAGSRGGVLLPPGCSGCSCCSCCSGCWRRNAYQSRGPACSAVL